MRTAKIVLSVAIAGYLQSIASAEVTVDPPGNNETFHPDMPFNLVAGSIEASCVVKGKRYSRHIGVGRGLKTLDAKTPEGYFVQPLLAFRLLPEPRSDGLPQSVLSVTDEDDFLYYTFEIQLVSKESSDAARAVAAYDLLNRESNLPLLETSVRIDPWPVRGLIVELRDTLTNKSFGHGMNADLTSASDSVEISVPIPKTAKDRFEKLLKSDRIKALITTSSQTIQYDIASTSSSVKDSIRADVTTALSNAMFGKQDYLLNTEASHLEESINKSFSKYTLTTNTKLLSTVTVPSIESTLFKSETIPISKLIGRSDEAFAKLKEYLTPLIKEEKSTREQDEKASDTKTTGGAGGIEFQNDSSGLVLKGNLSKSQADALSKSGGLHLTFESTSKSYNARDIDVVRIIRPSENFVVAVNDQVISIIKQDLSYKSDGLVDLHFGNPSISVGDPVRPLLKGGSFKIEAFQHLDHAESARRSYDFDHKYALYCPDGNGVPVITPPGEFCYKLPECGSDHTDLQFSANPGWEFDYKRLSITYPKGQPVGGGVVIDKANTDVVAMHASISSPCKPNAVYWKIDLDEVMYGPLEKAIPLAQSKESSFNWGQEFSVTIPPEATSYVLYFRFGDKVSRAVPSNNLTAAEPLIHVSELPDRSQLIIRPTSAFALGQ
jgi:hypothetical protein